MSTGIVHELRLELAGHQTADLRVVGTDWSNDGRARRAEIVKRLEPGVRNGMPPAPDEPPRLATRGLTPWLRCTHCEE